MKFTYSHWQSASGRWYCNNIKQLSGWTGKWYAPMRLLNLSIDEFVDLLMKYNAKGLFYNKSTDYLNYYFTSERDVKSFCSYINKSLKK